ncbi:MAG TPA: hypothetical protein VLX09_16010, partial [Stellaceae bacterium]|nr:hypothetical protein [Stellaceae bacterium]
MDIAGRAGGGPIEGVQCRLKDTTAGKAITLREIKKEIEKAEKFEPRLACLTFATTAAPDSILQKEVLKIDEARRQNGRFGVSLLSWIDLLDRIEEVPELAEIYGDQGRTISEILRVTLETRDKFDLFERRQTEPIARTESNAIAPAAPNIDDLLGAEIDRYRDLLTANRPALALELLEGIRSKRWDAASQKTRYRILTNIAAAKTRLGRLDGADDFISAVAFDPDAEQALCNVAYGHLLKHEFTAARDAACTAIEKYPKSISAHAILLGASSALRDTGDPLSLIPEDLQSEAAIAYGIGNFYRWKTDAATARVWFARAFEKDPNT